MMTRVLRKNESVGVEREDQVLDVITPFENVEDFRTSAKSGMQQRTIGARF